MKNMLIIAAAVLVAGITQAASVSWKVNGNADSVGKTVYLVLNDEVPSKIESLDDITDAAFASGEIKTGRTPYATGTASTDGVAIDQTKSYTIFFVDSASNSYLNGGTGTVKGYDPQQQALDPVAATSSYVAPGGAGWTKIEAVPEPTAVALLALGLVALGLKRKVA